MAYFNRSKKTKLAEKLGFRTFAEASVAQWLDKHKVKYEYEKHWLEYILPPKKYKPDFKLPNGIYIEVKGRFPNKDRQKMLWVIRQNPDEDIRILFTNPHAKLNKKSKTSYAEWCDRHEIKWGTVPYIPAEWINE